MSDKDIYICKNILSIFKEIGFVLKKIVFSIAFPIILLFHCILFFVGMNKQMNICWNQIIYFIREEYDRDSFTVIGYSFFPALLISIILFHAFKWCWEPISFFSIVLAIGALLVSIIIALALKKKPIENGEQFIRQLYIHINYLKHITDEKRELYIISPNINIGTGKDYKMGKIIKENKNIIFKFICKSIKTEYLDKYGTDKFMTLSGKHCFFEQADKNDSNMLKYLYDRYEYGKVGEAELDNLVNELREIINDNPNFEKPIEKYDEIEREQEKIGGYLSIRECVLGTYMDIKKEKGEVSFKGETVTSPELIKIVKTYILRKIGIQDAVND